MSKGIDQKHRTGRFGARYGTRIRRRVANVERVQFDSHRCPQCLTGELDRVSTSIWQCRKCEHKFAGGAYRPRTESFGQAQASEDELEEVAEDLEDDVPEPDEAPEPEPEPEPEEEPEPDADEAADDAEGEEPEPEPEPAADDADGADEEAEGDEDEPRDIGSLFE
jgi:large subunit ribosomal protein L37Ae